MTDNKTYSKNDMVRVGCNDCAGCFKCCCDMGQSVILDPLDMHRLKCSLHAGFEELMKKNVELHVEDGLILPNLKMDEKSGRCSFLNEQGRCSIHAFRPGICRLFPLGRNYREGRLDYFLLTDVCPAKNKSKVRVSRWLDTENLTAYENFLIEWHGFTKELRAKLQQNQVDEEWCRKVNLLFLQMFYVKDYLEEDFFAELSGRIRQMRQMLE